MRMRDRNIFRPHAYSNAAFVREIAKALTLLAAHANRAQRTKSECLKLRTRSALAACLRAY